MTAPLTLPVDDLEQRRIQRRTVAVLIAGQIISGLGIGAAVSMGALLVAAVLGMVLTPPTGPAAPVHEPAH